MAEIKVFVSSTWEDLREEREAVMEELNRMEIPFAAMEYFGSRDDPPLEVSTQELNQCQIYVGIIGFRYGSLVPEATKSFTESEYDYASERKLYRLVYLKEQSSCQDDFDQDQEKHDKLDRFRRRFTEDKECTVSFFNDATDLPGMIASDLFKHITKRISEDISEKLIVKTELFQMPRLIVRRAIEVLLHANKAMSEIRSASRRTSRAKSKALKFLDNYRLRFDGQFTVIDSNRNIVFHDIKKAIGLNYSQFLPDFDRIFQELLIGKNRGIIKWIDLLSSDYLLIDEAIHSGSPDIGWIRFSVSPFLYFHPWDWYIIVEAHNEIHGLERSEIQSFVNDFTKRGWIMMGTPYYLTQSARD